MTYFIRFYWSYNIKVVEIGYAAANSSEIIPNPGRVIFYFFFPQICLFTAKRRYLHNYLEHLHDFIYNNGNRALRRPTNYLQYTYTFHTEQ